MSTNSRDQKLTSTVAKDIEDSLVSNDGYFHIKNRGIVLSAQSVLFDTKKSVVTIFFNEDAFHGNIDGGHTYKIVQGHSGENLNQFVQFEVITAVEDIIEQLAEARNNSVQVDAKSLAELKNRFKPIKTGIVDLPFFNRIAFKQNQLTQDKITGKNNKMIDAREIVAILSMFNLEKYPEGIHPIDSYSSKEQV